MADVQIDHSLVTPVNEILGYQAIVAELESIYFRQRESIDAIKSTIRSYIQASSILITLIGAIQIWVIGKDNFSAPIWYLVVTGFISVLFLVLLVLSIIGLAAIKVSDPIKPSLEILWESFGNKTELEIIKVRISAFYKITAENDKKIQGLFKVSIVIGALLVVIVASIAFLIPCFILLK